MWWKRHPRSPVTFRGIRQGMSEKDVVQRLAADARARGEELTVSTTTDPGEGLTGTVRAEGAVWTIYASTNDDGDVSGRMGQWRRTPSGLDDGIAWLRERIREYGPPLQHAILSPTKSRPHESHLEWRGSKLHPTLTLLRDEDWDVREDWETHFLRRTDPVSLSAHRRALDSLQRKLDDDSWCRAREDGYRTSSRPDHEGLRAFVDKTSAWVCARSEGLDALGELVERVPVFDVFETLQYAATLVARIESNREEIHDGAFLIATWNAYSSPGHAIHSVSMTTCNTSRLLTRMIADNVRLADNEPLPPSPEAWVAWIPGPISVSLLRDRVLLLAGGLPFEILPASFVTVADAREEVLPMPRIADTLSNKLTVSMSGICPVRLVHSSGLSVHLNCGGSLDELRTFAHALLAAMLARRR